MRIVRLRFRLAPALGLGAALLAAASAARAEDYVRQGWYAGGRGVYALEDFDVPGTADDDFGFNLFAGYRMYKGFASDFEFEYIDAMRVHGSPGNPSFDLRTFDLAWNFRVYPLSWAFEPGSMFQRVQPYLSAGPSIQWVQPRGLPRPNQDDGGFAGRLGGGIDFLVTENIAVTADAIYTLGTGSSLDDFRYLSIGWGLAYRFGGGESSSAGEGDEEADEE